MENRLDEVKKDRFSKKFKFALFLGVLAVLFFNSFATIMKVGNAPGVDISFWTQWFDYLFRTSMIIMPIPVFIYIVRTKFNVVW